MRAWASHSSLERIDGLDDGPPHHSGGKGCRGSGKASRKRAKGDFPGLLLSNQTHCSTSDGEAQLFKKAPGVGAFLSFMGLCVMENRNGLVVGSEVSQATGMAERKAALRMARSLQVLTRKLWVPKMATTLGSSWPTCASMTSRPMWRRTSLGKVDQRLMVALQDIRAMPNRSMPGSASSRCSGGSNRRLASGNSRPEADQRWERCSGCIWWPTT